MQESQPTKKILQESENPIVLRANTNLVTSTRRVGRGAEQQPDNAESDVQSPDFVTAGGVSTKKKRSSNRIWLHDSPEKGLMTGGRFCILTVDIAEPWGRRITEQKSFPPEARKTFKTENNRHRLLQQAKAENNRRRLLHQAFLQ